MPLTYVFSRKTAVWGAVGEFIKDITGGKILLPQGKIPPPPPSGAFASANQRARSTSKPKFSPSFQSKSPASLPQSPLPSEGVLLIVLGSDSQLPFVELPFDLSSALKVLQRSSHLKK